MADSKISQLTPITGANILDSDEFIVARAGTFENFAVTRAEMFLDTPAITTSDLTATTADINGGTIDGTVIGGTTAAAGTFTNLTATTALTGTLATAAQPNVTSVGTLTSATITGDLTVDTDTLYVDSANNRVGIGTSSPATALDVTGTVTADGLTVDGSPSNSVVIKDDDSFSGADNQIKLAIAPSIANGESAGVAFGAFSSDDYWKQGIFWQRTSTFGVGDLIFANRESADTTTVTDADQRIRVARNGDISFYEDTGTTPKFFWDASAEKLGIGTSSPDEKLEVYQGNIKLGTDTNTTSKLIFERSATNRAEIYVSNTNALQFDTAGSEAMRIDSSGNVGIGTSSPNGKLSIRRDGGSALTLQAAQAGIGELNRIDFQNLSSTATDGNATARITAFTQGSIASGGMSFSTSPGSNALSEAMRIDSSGNVGIGTTSVGGEGGVSFEPGDTRGATRTTFNRPSGFGSGGSFPLVFQSNGTAVGSVEFNDTSTSYNTSSDERLKENIADAQPASDLIEGIQVREFDWKTNGLHQRYGMVAQELETVAPEAVSKGETEDDMWSVDYSKLVPMLVKEIQDLRKRVAKLET